ncbi:hypothetical protein D3C87_1435460 [compost metagenome]
MDRTRTVQCPCRRGAIKHGATATDLPTVEDRLATVDGVDDIQQGDFVGGPGQLEATAHAFGGNHQLAFGQLGEDLRQIVQGNALQFGKVAHARFARVAAVADEKKQAVDAVLDTCAVKRHTNLRLD